MKNPHKRAKYCQHPQSLQFDYTSHAAWLIVILKFEEVFMKAIACIAAAAIALTGCNAMTATADKIMNKKSNFLEVDTTAYPIGEGPNYDADVKADAALEDMKATQAVNGQYPKADSIDDKTQQQIDAAIEQANQTAQ